MFDFDMPPLDWRVCKIPKPKKPGEFRKITIPNDQLKARQREILRYLYKVKGLKASVFAHGFVPFRNTSTGVACLPKESEVILCMDVKDFFDNFPLEPIRKRMIEAGVGASLVEKILTACSFKNTIPQGGPCSPALTNIGMFEVDLMISAFARSRGYAYTRYADDITLSKIPEVTPEVEVKNIWRLFHGVEKILSTRLGLSLKHSKNHVIHLKGKEKRQVLGVVIRKDGKGYNAPKRMRTTARAMLCNLARKVESKGGRVFPEDRITWQKIVGYVRYFDNLRSYSDEDCATADPLIQQKYWDYLWPLFEKKAGERHAGACSPAEQNVSNEQQQ